MTTYIDKFLERVQGNCARDAKTFVMSMTDAKNLSDDIRYVLEQLHAAQTQVESQNEQTVEVKISGGTF